MLKTLLTAAIALSVIAPGFAQGLAKNEGKPVPKFTMTDTAGKTVSNTSLKGKVYVVDFWATWCAPCVAASPMMNKLHAKYAKQGLVILGANISDKKGAASAYKKEHKYGYTFTTGGEKLAQSLGVQGIPAFFFVDKKGVVRKVQEGFSPSLEADFDAQIKKLLAEK